MKRVSVRTLTLMMALLAAVVAHQYLASSRVPRAGAVWLAGNGTTIQQTQSCFIDCNS